MHHLNIYWFEFTLPDISIVSKSKEYIMQFITDIVKNINCTKEETVEESSSYECAISQKK